MNIPPFYVGQRVVAVEDHRQGAFKKGDVFTVKQIRKGCCNWDVSVGIHADPARFDETSYCRTCGSITADAGYEWFFSSKRFRAITDDFISITAKKVVAIESPLIGVN